MIVVPPRWYRRREAEKIRQAKRRSIELARKHQQMTAAEEAAWKARAPELRKRELQPASVTAEGPARSPGIGQPSRPRK
jgi:hypothetical protein